MIGNFQIASTQKRMLYMWSFGSDFNFMALMNLVRITKTMYAIYQEIYTASMGSLLYCTQNSKFKIHSSKLPNIWLTNNSTCRVAVLLLLKCQLCEGISTWGSEVTKQDYFHGFAVYRVNYQCSDATNIRTQLMYEEAQIF